MAIPYIVEIEDLLSSRNISLRVPANLPALDTLEQFLLFFRHADSLQLARDQWIEPGRELITERFKDLIFLLNEDGSVGDIDEDLVLQINEQTQEWNTPLYFNRVEGEEELRLCHIGIDRSQSGYNRNWAAFMERRWNLRAEEYKNFILDSVQQKYHSTAYDVLELDTAQKKCDFLRAIGERIYRAPYETYSRYLPPYYPFKSCDEVLDSIIGGDGGICSEKAMAMYFIAEMHGIPCEIVLGGEGAQGDFPYEHLRSLLDQPTFDFRYTSRSQKFWEHFALICHLGEKGDGQELFCDIANSNIPLTLLARKEAEPYLKEGPGKQPLVVNITVSPVQLYYHRISEYQDIPLNLYQSMEQFFDFTDLIQTIDNELGLVITQDFWVGLITYATEQERKSTIDKYRHELVVPGMIQERNLHFEQDIENSKHPLVREFRSRHPQIMDKLINGYPYLMQRIYMSNEPEQYQVDHVFLKLTSSEAM